MEDAENSLPPSKKRSAGRELTRDTPIDDEEDSPELESGTFKRASEEVLATRRIVKVRRQQPTRSAPSSNPFAGIRLVTPTESSANPSEATTQAQLASENTTADDTNGITKDSEKAKDENVEQSETKDSEKEVTEKENTAEESGSEKPEVNKEQSKDDNNNKNEDKHVADKESAGEVDKKRIEHESVTENNDKKEKTDKEDKKADKVESEEPSTEGGPLKSFQQLSSSQNAFTGLSGTGFSSSSFSFGSISTDASALGSTSGSIFGTKNDKPFGLGLSNNGVSLFGAAGTSAASKSEGSSFPTMQEVVVETGEENERAVFNADSILFEYVDGSWKERGKGELKINVTTTGINKARLLMRSRGNYRLILNARLYPDMKLTNMEKKGVTFACINSATEGKDGLSTIALKFKDGSIVEEFKAAVMAHKGEASRGLKTPENSP
ncbi:nuclear pore complex protein NUP50A-like [Senna tora]|uniref:Nuclear pore complex protein NUP50A-like n=1 Tax=Senna tora TaxID=362788 RepID=A0A834XEX0_9FABA|nr:nuclear pore complex protein NUP50A-like [Senna tora]